MCTLHIHTPYTHTHLTHRVTHVSHMLMMVRKESADWEGIIGLSTTCFISVEIEGGRSVCIANSSSNVQFNEDEDEVWLARREFYSQL